jgi:hypothetical protein
MSATIADQRQDADHDLDVQQHAQLNDLRHAKAMRLGDHRTRHHRGHEVAGPRNQPDQVV